LRPLTGAYPTREVMALWESTSDEEVVRIMAVVGCARKLRLKFIRSKRPPFAMLKY
jgi:hypothetical protein